MTKHTPTPHQRQRLIALISHAIKLSNIAVYLGIMAVAVFLIFGTLASLPAFKGSVLIYMAFHYLPYLLIGLSVPISGYLWLILVRYRIIQMGILHLMVGLGVGGMLISGLFYAISGASVSFFMSVFLVMLVWFGMPYLFRVNLKKFLKFLTE